MMIWQHHLDSATLVNDHGHEIAIIARNSNSGYDWHVWLPMLDTVDDINMEEHVDSSPTMSDAQCSIMSLLAGSWAEVNAFASKMVSDLVHDHIDYNRS